MTIDNNKKISISLEVSTLSESSYTGIANVTKNLAIELLNDRQVDARFFMFRNEIPKKIIEQLVKMDEGEILWWLCGRVQSLPKFDIKGDSYHLGIYPWQKKHRYLFPFEVQIVHDITPVIFPEFHTGNTISDFTHHLLSDMLSSDLLVAVSQSTLTDIRSYYPQVDHIPGIYAHLGCNQIDIPHVSNHPKFGKYILTLGTIEPRKNVKLVLECLSRYPSLLNEFTFIFVGRWGWGEHLDDMINELNLEEYVNSGKIVFTGFVTNQACHALIQFSHGIIYPSNYEGFGLPIIESLQYGKPIVASWTSSIPEIAEKEVIYADVASLESLKNAICKLQDKREATDSIHKIERQKLAKKFTWSAMYTKIKDAAIETYLSKKAD